MTRATRCTLAILVGGGGRALLLCVTPDLAVEPTEALPRDSTTARSGRWSRTSPSPTVPFRSDNLVSNELTFEQVIPRLQADVSPASAYIGVGPDQNFTYIAALKPRIAFIVDIRRQNMLLHLMYKALIERSPTRARIPVALVFSRQPRTDVPAAAAGRPMLAAYPERRAERPSHSNGRGQDIRRVLTEEHGFTLRP